MQQKTFSSYKPTLIPRARNLRSNSTLSEVLLWEKLKGKQLFNYKFRRQVSISNYIIDFYCKELCLGIEIDGISHDNKIEYDIERQKQLEKLELTILHYNDLDIKRDVQNVLQRICDWIDANPPRSRY